MQDQKVGSAFRAVRIRRGWRQLAVADRAGVSRGLVSAVERGHLDGVTLGSLRAIAAALDIRLDIVAFWQGGELGRIINAGHSAMHEAAAGILGALGSWTF